MMAGLLWDLVSRIFIFLAFGALVEKLLGKRGAPVAAMFFRFVIGVLIPVFVLLSLWATPLPLKAAWKIAVVPVLVMGAGAFFAWLLARARKTEFRKLCLPVVFMNSAYLAIPVSALLWGQEGVAYALVYNAVLTLGHFTVGVWWVSPRRSIGDIVGLPVVYATVAGIVINLLRINPPSFVTVANGIVSFVTLPVMLLFVGYRLRHISLVALEKASIGVALRMGGGWLIALMAVKFFGITGVAAGVCVIVSGMPASVNSYILSEYFDADAEFAAAAVFLGTVISLATVPLMTLSLH